MSLKPSYTKYQMLDFADDFVDDNNISGIGVLIDVLELDKDRYSPTHLKETNRYLSLALRYLVKKKRIN